MMGQAIQQSTGHFSAAEHGRPLGEGEICGDDDRSAFVEPADQVEEQLAAGLSEWQVTKFVEHDQIDPGKVLGHLAGVTGARFGFQTGAVAGLV